MTSYAAALPLLATLRTVLTDAGIRNAEDPGQLTPPGVLVQVTGLDLDTLTGLEVSTRLLLVSPASDHERSLAELLELLDAVAALADPDGPITTASVVLPGDPAPLPALVFPLNLTT